MSDSVIKGDLATNFIPKITVLGVGGAGVNAVNNMILSQLENVKFVVANTDCQSLVNSLAENKIQLGVKCTKGLGAGSNPEIGRQAAEEAIDDIKKEISGTDMLFIATGMGGGTGTGASPVIAKIARDMGILTVAIATKPFNFEGRKRLETANSGVVELEKLVDTLIIIENQKLAMLNNATMGDNFALADSILRHAVYCVVDILVKPGFINRDFADIKTILSSMGRAIIGYGESPDANMAVNSAINNPILENSSIYGAHNILVNIAGNRNLRPNDIQNIIDRITEEANTDPQIIFGIVFDEALGDNIRVSIIAAGVDKSVIGKTADEIDSEKKYVKAVLNNKSNDTIVDDSLNSSDDNNSIIDFDTQNKKYNTNSNLGRINEDDLIVDNVDNISVNNIELNQFDVDNESVFVDGFKDIKKKKIMSSNRAVNIIDFDNRNNTQSLNQDNNNISFNEKKQDNTDVDYAENNNDVSNQKMQKKHFVRKEHNAVNNTKTLFDQTVQKKKSGVFSRLFNAVSPNPFTTENTNDIESLMNDDDDEQDYDIYSTPAIERKKRSNG